METDAVAIYKVSNADYCRLLVATTDDARQMGKSLKYSEEKELMESLRRHEVFANRNLQEKLPAMAYGICHGDELEYILMVWNLPLEKMSLHQMNLLKVIGNMVQNTITRSDMYLDALSDKRYLPGTDILTRDAFAEEVETSREISRRAYGESALICVRSAGRAEELQKNGEELERYDGILSRNLRETDSFGVGEDGYIYILLTNSNQEEAGTVIRRLASKGVICSVKEGM